MRRRANIDPSTGMSVPESFAPVDNEASPNINQLSVPADTTMDTVPGAAAGAGKWLSTIVAVITAVVLVVGAVATLGFVFGLISFIRIDNLAPIPRNALTLCDTSCSVNSTFAVDTVRGCIACTNTTGGMGINPTLSDTGAGISAITDGTGPAMSITRFLGIGPISQVLNGPVLETSIDDKVMLSCFSSPPACAANQFVAFNGSCYQCFSVQFPTDDGLPLCGACTIGQYMVLGTNSTCIDCVAPFSLSSVGAGSSVVNNGATGALKSIAVGPDMIMDDTPTQLTMYLGANVMRQCNQTCTPGFAAVWNSTCFTCTNMTAGPSVVMITSVGTGASFVVNGIAPAITVRSETAVYPIVVTQLANEIEISAPGVLPLCGACSAGQSITLGTNSTCYSCVDITSASTALPLCGACTAGQLITLGANSTCYDCTTPINTTLPANLLVGCGAIPTCTSTQRLSSNGSCSICLELPVQTPPSSSGNGTSIIANSTTNTFKSVAGSGSTTIVDAADLVTVNSPVLVSTSTNATFVITPPGGFITDTSFEVLASSATVELRPRTYQYAGFVSTPASVNCIASSVAIGWWHEMVVSEDTSVFGPFTNIIRTHNIVLFLLEVTSSGFFRFEFNDGTATDHLGPNNADFFIGGGVLTCDPSFSVVLDGGVYVSASNAVIVSGSAPAFASYACQAVWMHDSMY